MSANKHRIRTRWSTMVSLNPRVPQDQKLHTTKQEFAKEVNINHIMRKARDGIDPPRWMTSKTPMYGDFTNQPTNFQDAFSRVEAATAAFYSLPVEFRRELGHDPRNLPTAPKELFAKYGLLKAGAEAPAEGPGKPQARPEGPHKGGSQGDANPPAKSAVGANKGAKNAPVNKSSDED